MSNIAIKLAKATLSMNLGVLVRLARFGFRDAAGRLAAGYLAVDPFRKPMADATAYSTIRRVALRDLVTGNPLVTLDGRFSHTEGSLPLEDMIPLLTLLRDRSPGSVLEIGTFNGTTTKMMALNLPEATIHTLDLPEDSGDTSISPSDLPKDDFHLIESRLVGEAFRSDGRIRNVVQHLGDSARLDFSTFRGVSFFFIDGSHTYEYIKNDTEKCLAACTGRATFVWHDFDLGHPGVVRWLAEMVSAGYPVVGVDGTCLAVMDWESRVNGGSLGLRG